MGFRSMASSMSSPSQQTVAVIGLGGMGIVAVKNLLEEGFDVTGFERSGYVGGLWHYTDDAETLSVLPSTRTNVSMDRGCYTDYPFPKGTPAFCSAGDIEAYLENYVDHFGLRTRFHLNSTVTRIIHQDDTSKWRLDIDSQPSKYFDKVVVATGPHIQPTMPDLRDSHLFSGDIIHSRAFKSPENFRGKRVLLVGLGNTAGDIADDLAGVASSVVMSHNRGAVIMPRTINGLPASRLVTHRSIRSQAFGEKYFPTIMERAVNNKAKSIMRNAFGKLDPTWGLDPAPSLQVSVPVVSDTLVSHLRSGAVRSVASIRRIIGPAQIELEDGDTVEADVVICCTGYQNNFGLLDPRFDPSAEPCPAWLKAPGSRGRPLPRLYQNIFSLKAPDSLAFVGCVWFATGAFCLADLASMCISQIWAGKSSLPPASEMDRWVDGHERRLCELAKRGSPIPGSVPQGEWLAWADCTAGTGVFDRLGWGCKGWQFWWRERELWRLIMDGVLTSAVWRLFDEGKRRTWDGARKEVVSVNEEAAAEREARN